MFLIQKQSRTSLFENFKREIKLLHQIQHCNVVRIFNYYLYPESFAGFILMEYVDGQELDAAIVSSPEKINDFFLQAIDGFRYLEERGILHRDIRPGNIMVDSFKSVLKIIDLGFGKRIENSVDFEKSITLNWWCAPPEEFRQTRYDFGTEVYFVGKLFEKLVLQNSISNFNHWETLRGMCELDPANRIKTFADVEKRIRSKEIAKIGFTGQQIAAYRNFANAVTSRITKVQSGARYVTDVDKVMADLQAVYECIMLEEYVTEVPLVASCIVDGTYFYSNRPPIQTSILAGFLDLLKAASPEQRRIVMANVHTKLDSLQRYEHDAITDDDIPF